LPRESSIAVVESRARGLGGASTVGELVHEPLGARLIESEPNEVGDDRFARRSQLELPLDVGALRLERAAIPGG
jgi:hypothetical protein